MSSPLHLEGLGLSDRLALDMELVIRMANLAPKEIGALNAAIGSLLPSLLLEQQSLEHTLSWTGPDPRADIVAALARCKVILGLMHGKIRRFEARSATRALRYWAKVEWEILGGKKEIATLRAQLADEVVRIESYIAIVNMRYEHAIRSRRDANLWDGGPASLLESMRMLGESQSSGHPPSPSDWVEGTVIRVDKFVGSGPLLVRLVSSERVSTGASAAIFKGRSPEGDVAMKVFGGVMSQAQRQALRRELHNVRDLSHEHILPFIGSATHELKTILISPFMKNGDMIHYLRAHRNVEREDLILQVARGVEYLHVEQQLIHGDIKCENVLISDSGKALLTDFGLSTFIDNSQSNTTLTGLRACNTLPFAAPELLLGEISQGLTNGHLRPRSKSTETDVYAFGMLIVQAYLERSPWPGLNATQVITRVISGRTHPRPGYDIDSAKMSNSWWQLCLSCWKREPGFRPRIADVVLSLQDGDPPSITSLDYYSLRGFIPGPPEELSDLIAYELCQ